MKNTIIASFKNFMTSINKKKVVIGVSGGIDSIVCLVLAVETLGNENVTALFLPEKGNSSGEEDVVAMTKKLNVELIILPIILPDYSWKQTKISSMNLKPRIRMTTLYNYANAHDAIVVGTGNKSEIYLGYCTKYGDSAADVLLIGDLYKTEVFELAKSLNIPDTIINKKPSAELFEGQTDEQELGISYEVADKILINLIDKNMSKEEIINLGFKEKDVDNVILRVKTSKHKRNIPLILKK